MAEIGSVLGGRYRLVELLGQGGMATVYRATDAQLGRDVAVKVLRPEYGRDPDFIARFRLEAQSVASLSSPNIVIVHDFGMDTAGPFIVMDLVPGEDLASVLRRVGALPPTQAARIASEVARALSAAHARGIIHRDIKPGNILLANGGRVLVTDFGIARALAEAQMTLPGMTMGSVQYMSPEQARGEPATERSDIYSLGVVLFEMLAGRRPFEGDSAAAIAVARLTPPVPMPSSFRVGIPPVLEAICRKAMAIDPAERFQTAAAMAAALDDEIADRPVPAAAATAAMVAGAGVVGVARANAPAPVPNPPDAYAGGGRPSGPPPSDGGAPEDGSGSGPWAWVAGLLGLGLLIVIGFIVFRLMSGGSAPVGSQVVVPNFVGQTLDQAQTLAQASGIVVSPTKFVTSSDQPEGTITEQDPAANAQVDKGATISVTVVTGKALVAVPDLRNLTEAAAITALVQAQLTPGTSTDAADPEVPKGSVISSSPATGVEVAVGTTVDYLLSTGPEATPSPSPTPTPSPTPPPTPPPTPTPTPPPPPTPTPTPLSTVGEYRCQTLNEAKADIAADGFVVGTVTPQPAGYTAADDSFVFEQLPLPGKKRAFGTKVDLSVYDPASYPFPTCPPTP